MGACGCSDTNFEVQFPGPNETTYALEIYSSCHYCGSPVGVIVHQFDPSQDHEEEIWLDSVPTAQWIGGDQFTPPQLVVTVLGADELSNWINDFAGDEDIDPVDPSLVAMALPVAVTVSSGVVLPAEGVSTTKGTREGET